MSRFRYRARKNSEIVSGHVMAVDAGEAVNKLERKGLIVIEISEEIERSITYDSAAVNSVYKDALSIKEKKEFFTTLYFQYKSGLPIREIFHIIAVSATSINIKTISSIVKRDIEEGRTLEEALMPFSNALGKEYTVLVCTGEKSGKLNEVLSSIVKSISREEEIKGSIISAMTYPACILSFAIIIFVFFKTFILKIFTKMFDGIGQEEIKTLLILALIKVFIVIVILGAGVFFLLKNKTLKRKAWEAISSLPFLEKLFTEYYMQNFFIVLSLAYEAGVPAYEAVSLAAGVIKNWGLRRKLNKSIQMISKGCELTTAFMVAGIFSKFALSQISAGEKAGELEKMFKAVAYDYEKKLEVQISVITKLMEPFILIFIGIMVAYIVCTAYSKYYESLFSML